jgi:beta-phosphoglucomutase
MTRAVAAIVLDFDGVIADSERLHLSAYQHVVAPLNIQLSERSYFEQYLGYDDIGVFRMFARNNGLAWDDQEIGRLCKAKGECYAELCARGEMLFPGAARFIKEAADAVPIAVASGALTQEIEEILERTDLRPLFVAIVGADQTARSKPSPDPYLEALHRLALTGVSAERSRVVAIEDSVWGLVSARTAGLRTVAVTNTYSADELAGHAELVVSGLDALTLEMLDRLCESPPTNAAMASGRRSRP